MLSSGNNLSALFRTLAPEETDLTAVTKSADPAIGQEWPLFKVVAPTKPEPTPPLTPQERRRWGVQETARVEPNKPALSMSGLSSKLARSLGQISERMVSEAPPSGASMATEQPKDRMNPPAQDPDPVSPSRVRASLFSKTSPAAGSQDKEEKGRVIGLFERTPRHPDVSLGPVPGHATAGDSLSDIFSRLEVSDKTIAKPVEKRSSLSTRLGKR